MDTSKLISHITTECPLAAQVLAAEDITQNTVDTHSIIYNLIKDAVNGNAHPVKMPLDKEFPVLVYQRVSSNKISFAQFNMLQTDVFVLHFQAESYKELVDIQNTLTNSLTAYNQANTAGDIEITDTAEEYLPDQDLYQSAIELNIVHLNGNDQSLPAIFVYESNNSSANNEMINTVIQWDNVTLNCTIIAKHDQLQAMRDQLQTAVLGYREQNYGSGAERTSADRLESLNHTTVWEEQYRLKLRPLFTTR